MPYKILYIVSGGQIGGGGEFYLLRILRQMDRSRFEPIVLMPQEGSLRAALEELGVEVLVEDIDISWLRPDKRWYAALSTLTPRVEKLVGLLRERHIDIVHTNTNTNFEGALAARIAGIRSIYVCHIELQTDVPLYERFPLDPATFAALMDDLSSHVIAVSSNTADTISPPINRQKLTVIPNGVEVELYDLAYNSRPGNLRSELGIDPDCPIIMNISRLAPDKGIDAMINAASKVMQDHPEAHFVHVGPHTIPHYRDEMFELAKPLGNRFHFLGYRDDIPELLSSSDIFLLSSEREGGPYVLVEAMLTGNAIVSTRCGGLVPDVIEDGVTGLMVEIGDSSAMASKILELLQSPDRTIELGRMGRDRVREAFDVARSAKRLFQIYDKIMENPPPLPGSPASTMFLRAATEIAHLGNEVVDLKERMKKVERAAELFLDNPVAKLARKILRKGNA